MAIGTNFPVDGIEQLAARVRNQRESLYSELAALRNACQRDPAFSGTAAVKYDEFLGKWDSSERNLQSALQGVEDILMQLSRVLRQTDSAASQAFNV